MDGSIIQIDKNEILTYVQYLSDESRKTGFAQSISFPKDAADTAHILSLLAADGIPVTIQGARTGLSGAAVPQGGHIISCTKMGGIGQLRKAEGGEFILSAGAGTTMSDIEEFLLREKRGLFWPPAPTESGATVGGVLAGKARGLYAVKYGDAADWVTSIEEIGEVIISAELRLMPLPKSIWGIAFFFGGFDEAFGFVQEADEQLGKSLAALEYLNSVSLKCISDLRRNATSLKGLPDTTGHGAMVFTEIHSGAEALSEESAVQLMDISEKYGSDPDCSWAMSGAEDVAHIRIISHAAQEAILSVHDARLGGEALGLDLALEDGDGAVMLKRYLSAFSEQGIETAVFGSLIGGRLRVSPLPDSDRKRTIAAGLLENWKGMPTA